MGGAGRLGGAGLRGFGEFFAVSFTSGSKSHRLPGAADEPPLTGTEALAISSTALTCGGAWVVALGLAGAGLGGGGRFGRGFRLSS